jgi:O-antigen ligase
VASFVIIIKVSGSRQGLIWLMFVVALICAVRFRKNVVLGFIGSAFFGLFLLGVLFLVFNKTELVQRILIVFDQRMMAIDPERSVLDRWEMYKVGFDMWLQSPIWGNGNEAFRAFSPWAGSYSHSNYIEILANYGTLGFLFFYVPIALVVSRSISMFYKVPFAHRTLLLCVSISFIAILVSGFFIPTFYRKPMVVFMAYLFAMFYNIREDVSRGGQSGQMTTNRRRW